MTDVLTITVNPALDLSTEAPAVIPDQKLRCSAPRVQPGGGGVNVSRAIANLGGRSRTLIAFGGHTGAILVDKLKAEGLEPISLDVAYPTRESVTVRDAANGLQYRFMMPGPPWTAEDCLAARQAIGRAMRKGDLVVKSGSNPPGMPDDFFMDLNREITAAGGRLVLDTSGPALARAGAGGANLYTLRMDLAEARELSGRDLVRIEDVADFARELRRNGAAEIVLIAAGAQGTVIDCDDWTGLTRPPVVVPLSKVGAGDSFVAAFCLALMRGADPVEACAWGTAAAASAVTTADTDLCSRADTERYVKQVTRTPL
jgi:6-phosphofructokinase 2